MSSEELGKDCTRWLFCEVEKVSDFPSASVQGTNINFRSGLFYLTELGIKDK
jgi:hypothetical protein